MEYGEFVSHVLGLLDAVGVLDIIRNFHLFLLAGAGMMAFVSWLRGR